MIAKPQLWTASVPHASGRVPPAKVRRLADEVEFLGVSL